MAAGFEKNGIFPAFLCFNLHIITVGEDHRALVDRDFIHHVAEEICAEFCYAFRHVIDLCDESFDLFIPGFLLMCQRSSSTQYV